MKKCRVLGGVLGLWLAALGSGQGSAADFLIQTGFEPEQGYALADLHGQRGWSVEGGSAEVWSQTVYAGTQAARIAPWGSIRQGAAAAASVVMLRSFLQAEPTMAPDIPSVGQAVVLYLDADYGLTGLDGDGQGGGHWVGSGITIPTGTWFELTVEVNFEAKTWECAVNGRPALSGLRFHSNDVVGFGSVDLASSERDVVLDQLTVSGSNPPPSEGTDRVAGVPLAMGFEPQEGYALGDLDTQKGWEVDVGQAEVWTQTVHSGLQAARIAPGGRVSHRFATGLPKTTFSTYLQATPSSAPEIPSAGQAAVLYLDPVLGLTCLDGDGNGGGRWVGSGVSVPAGVWFQLTLNLDFESKTWECLVNGQPALSGLHFHANHVTAFGFMAAASDSGDTLLDSARVDASIAPTLPSPQPGPVSTFPFGWGFEPAEGYVPGDLEAQQGWTVDAGRGEVWTQTVHSGLQAARIAPGGRVSHRFATGLPKTTFSTYLQATPSAAPEIPSTGQAAVLYLDPVLGLTCLDGDGNGGGRWVGSGVIVPAGVWFQLTLNLDFESKTWECLVNGQPALSGLHFHANHVTAFGSMAAASDSGDTLLDSARVDASIAPTVPTQPAGPVSTFPFGWGFETAEGYFPGDLEGQQGWTVDAGRGEVWTQTVYSGAQAARVEPGGQVSRHFATGLPRITFRSHVQATPTPPPDIPSAAQAAVLYLDPDYGLTGLNGDGAGGGHWVGSGVKIQPGTWFELTVRLDIHRKTWDCLVDGRLVLAGLRFHSDDVVAFGSVVAAADLGDTLLDAMSIRVADTPIVPEFPALTSSHHGFEPEEGYFLGDLDQQQGWTVRDGESQVWSNAVHSGVQAARIEPGSRIFQNVAMASPIVIFDGYLRASPSATPEIPDTAQIAVVYLDAVNGITGLDGDGNGGGRWVGSGVTVPADAWFRATIRVDFASKTWSCAINGALALTNLRFHADGIATFASFAAGASSGGATLLDEVRFVAEEGPSVAPILTVGIVGRDLEISWPADVAGYRLQVTPSLEKPVWVDVVTTGNRFVEKPDQATQFYRLIAP